MSEPWQGQDTADAPPPDLSSYAGITAVNEALFGLGVLKPGERINVLHAHACAAGRSQLAPCTCPGGAELIYADYDELSAQRHYVIPERFYERH
jgi:hypothetical protein